MEDTSNLSSLPRCDSVYTTYYSRYPSRGIYLTTDVFVIIANISLSLLGSVANGSIIAAYCRNKRLRNEHTMLLCVLACTDLVITGVIQPLFVVTKFGNVLGTFNNCTLWSTNSLLSYIFLSVSMLDLIIISFERFAVLQYACRYKAIVTPRRLKIAVCCSWALVLLVACAHIVFRVHELTFLFYVIISFSSVVGCLSLGALTEKVLRYHRRSMKRTQSVCMDAAQIKARKKQHRSTRTAFIIGATLLACYLPGMVMLVYEGLYESDNADFYLIVRPCVITFMYVNSALDPCVVLWRNREIRNTVANIFDRTRWSDSNTSN